MMNHYIGEATKEDSKMEKEDVRLEMMMGSNLFKKKF